MSALRPLSLGELIDRSAHAWRAHWRPLFQLVLGFQLFQYALLKAWQMGLARWVPGALNPRVLVEALKQDPLLATGQVVAGFGVMGLATLFFTQFAGVAEAAFIYPRLTGTGAPGLGESLRVAVKRVVTSTAALALSLGWSAVVAGLAQVPTLGLGVGAAVASRADERLGLVLGILAVLWGSLALVGTVLWYVVRYFCLAQVVALEPGGAWHAFRRADALSSGRVEPGLGGLVKVRLALLITVVGMIIGLLTMVASAPATVLQVVYGNALDPAHADPTAVPNTLLVPAELVQVVGTSLFAPVFAVFQVMFYVDMRVRREGLDLALRLERDAGGATP